MTKRCSEKVRKEMLSTGISLEEEESEECAKCERIFCRGSNRWFEYFILPEQRRPGFKHTGWPSHLITAYVPEEELELRYSEKMHRCYVTGKGWTWDFNNFSEA